MRYARLLKAALVASSLACGAADPAQLSLLPVQSMEVDKGFDIAALEKKHAGHDAVYLERITRYENEVFARNGAGYEWNLVHLEYTKLLVLNVEDEDYTTARLVVPRYHELGEVQLSIWSPAGGYRTFGKSDLKEERNSNGYTVYKFAFPGVVKGSIITKAFSVRQLYCFKDWPLDYEIPLQYWVPCEKASFTLVYPYGWESQVKKIAENKTIPVTVVKDRKRDRVEVSYAASQVPALVREPFSPFYKEVASYAELQLTSIYMKAGGYYPVIYKASKDWNDLSKEFKSYIMNRDPLFSNAVNAKAHELTKDKASPVDKLDSIISWLQDNMKVVDYFDNKATGMDRGNFGHNLARQEGTVAQITGLAVSMLQKAGVPAKYALIHSAEEGYFDPQFFSYSQLGRVGVYAEIEGRTYLAFPCHDRMPVDYIPEQYQGQIVLTVDPEGKHAFQKIPMGGESSSDTTEHYQVTLQEDGKILVEEERVLKGATAFRKREELVGKNDKKLEAALKEMLTFSEGKVTLLDHALVDLQDFRKPLTLKMKYEVENLLTLAPDEVVFNTGGLFRPMSRIKAKDSASDRQNDIRIYFDEVSRKNITLKYPEKWKLSTKLQDFKLENGFGSVTGTYASEPGTLKAEQVLTLNHGAAPREKYPDLQALTGRKTVQAMAAVVFTLKP